MKGILEFDLPDDEHDFEDACSGTDAFCCIHELAELLRARVKYGKPTDVATPEDAYNELRAEFFSILDSHDINLDR
jgi:hypothetical protein